MESIIEFVKSPTGLLVLGAWFLLSIIVFSCYIYRRWQCAQIRISQQELPEQSPPPDFVKRVSNL